MGISSEGWKEIELKIDFQIQRMDLCKLRLVRVSANCAYLFLMPFCLQVSAAYMDAVSLSATGFYK